jgi:hypothetical protein
MSISLDFPNRGHNIYVKTKKIYYRTFRAPLNIWFPPLNNQQNRSAQKYVQFLLDFSESRGTNICKNKKKYL